MGLEGWVGLVDIKPVAGENIVIVSINWLAVGLASYWGDSTDCCHDAKNPPEICL